MRRDDAERSPHHVVADVDRRGFDLHALHARGRRRRGRRVGRLLELGRRLLHLLDRGGGGRPVVLHHPTQTRRRLRQLVDECRRLRTQAVEHPAAGGHQRHEHHRRGQRARQAPPHQPRDHRLERVADQHGEHDRNDHRLRVLQDQHEGEPRQDGQRGAADVHRHPDRQRRLGSADPCGSSRLRILGRGLRILRLVGDGLQRHDFSSSSCSALLMAHAAFTPSAAATTTNCASREASPAT